MEGHFVNAIILLPNVSDGRDQRTIQVTEDCEDLMEKVAKIIMSLQIGIHYGPGFKIPEPTYPLEAMLRG